jgi:transposase
VRDAQVDRSVRGGIDVGQALLLVVCVRVVDEDGKVLEQVRSFGATTPDLLDLRDWLTAAAVTHVAMESTGVYWKAPYYLLEDAFEVLLVNATHLKHVPGRKTDVIDAQWIAEVLSYGLLRPSFVPPRPLRELRDLTRYRKALIRARTAEVNRLHKVLEVAGVKLATVATDVMGVSGREMMHALIAGVADPDTLADLAKARLRSKLPRLRKALTARFREHYAFLLARMLAHVEALEADIEVLSQRIAELCEPWAGHLAILDSITGVGPRAAEVILAEIGPDMSRFPSAGHLASWAGRCPGQRESAGRRGSAKPRKGSPWLADVLTGVGGGQDQGHLLVRLLPAGDAPPRQAEGGHGAYAQDPGNRLAPAVQRRALRRSRRGLAAQEHRGTTTPPRDPPTRSARPQGHR